MRAKRRITTEDVVPDAATGRGNLILGPRTVTAEDVTINAAGAGVLNEPEALSAPEPAEAITARRWTRLIWVNALSIINAAGVTRRTNRL